MDAGALLVSSLLPLLVALIATAAVFFVRHEVCAEGSVESGRLDIAYHPLNARDTTSSALERSGTRSVVVGGVGG